MRIFCLLFCLLGTYNSLFAQNFFYKTDFGKNRIQYKQFEWKYFSSQNFELYFYQEGEDIAKMAAGYAEADFLRMTDLIGYSPYNKIKIFVYNSVTDLQQSNVGIDAQGISTGGQTKFFKPEIELAFTGDKVSFQKELNRSIATALVFEMMYGGSLKDMLRSNYLLSLPNWFVSGVTQYIAEGWSSEMDDYLRDMLKYRKLKNIDNLEGKDAQLVGQSIWNYIAEEYGRQNIANILNLTRIVRNAESGIQNTIGVSFQRFSNDWKKFYISQLTAVAQGHQAIPLNLRLKNNKSGATYNQFGLHATQNLLAYSENKNGKFKVRLRNLATNKETTVLVGGYKTTSQAIDFKIPILAWLGENLLGVIHYEKGKMVLSTYSLSSKKTTQAVLPFSHVHSFAASDDGKTLVLSAAQNGQNDLYSYETSSQKVRQLTNDVFDDLTPAFMKNGDIVFSSNRTSDSLSVAKKASLGEVTDRFNIFLLQPTTKKLQRITNTISTDLHPSPINDTHIVFTSTQRGINHLFCYDLKEGTTHQVSNTESSVGHYDYRNKQLIISLLHKGNMHLFRYNNFDVISTSVFSQKTARQEMLDVRNIKDLRKQKGNQPKKDTVKIVEDETPKDTVVAVRTNPYDIDTDNYVFDTPPQGQQRKKKKLLENYKPIGSPDTEPKQKPETFELSRAIPYINKFGADNLKTNFLIDPLRGAGMSFETGLMELFENHQFSLGALAMFNLRNANYYAEYQYLKKRLDYKVRFDRQTYSIFGRQQTFLQRYALNKAQATVSYPITVNQRVSATGIAAQTTFDVTSTYGGSLGTSIQSIPEKDVYYGGFQLAYTFDNVISPAPNVYDGLKAKVVYENLMGLGIENKNFGNITAEVRYYKRLGKQLVLATRAMYGQFLGEAAKTYRLGGMDNWIISSSDAIPATNSLYFNDEPTERAARRDYTDYLFSPFVTPLRGFNFNRLLGQGVFVANAELRIPVANYISRGNITSNFVRNLQFVGFFDIGTAWKGDNPFSRDNSVNIVEFIRPNNAFPYAKVLNFKNPFLMGYGFGVRSMVLGIYNKLDVAWGIEDNQVKDGVKLYWTLGVDF